MKQIALVLGVLFTASGLYAQTDVDALRFSQTGNNGTARSVSMGGAFGALGGDFSVLSTNPAGIGLYRKSELSFSPSVFSTGIKSTYLGNTNKENKYQFNFNNIGAVFTMPYQRYDTLPAWNNWNFGIGYNRINNFGSRFSFSGNNTQNSLLDYYAKDAEGQGPNNLDQFGAYLAYYNYLINPLSATDTTHYTSAMPAGAYQTRTVYTKGSSSEVPISVGGNYNDRLYIGAALGITFLNYEEQVIHEEKDQKNTAPDVVSFKQTQNLSTSGTGYNFKFGMIYRFADWIRVGAAFHTPTSYSLHDTYSSSISSLHDNGDRLSKDSPQGTFDYEFTTPMKAIASAAITLQKKGVLSMDYEFIDYSDMRFNSSQDPFYDVNQMIQNKYTASGNLKIGGEWRVDPFSLRAGFAHFGSAFKDAQSDNSRNSFSLGFGIRDRNYTVDFGYVFTTWQTYYNPYVLAVNTPTANNRINTNNLVMTLGFKF